MRCECLLSRRRRNAAVTTPQRKRDWVTPKSIGARRGRKWRCIRERGKTRPSGFACQVGKRGGEKRERVDLGHSGGDDRVNPRGLSHPILSSNEPKTGNAVSAVTCFWRTY